jgi:hypothetical protein
MANRSDREEVNLHDCLDFESFKEMRPFSADFHQGHANPSGLLQQAGYKTASHLFASRTNICPIRAAFI